MENPSYYSILPASVRYDERLNFGTRLLYSEITALANKEGYCFASNSYFALLYKVSTNTISDWIQKLIECKYITSIIDKQAGNQRKLYISDEILSKVADRGIIAKPDTFQTSLDTPLKPYLETPIQPSLEHNNTSSNSTSINKEAPEENSGTLFLDDTKKKTMFRNSAVADINVFMKQFKDWEALGVDLYYYYHAVADWNDTKNNLRTARGWLATARQFMRSDNEKHKLKKINGVETKKATEEAMFKFMNS